jgi:hypothetical protein
MPTIRFNSAKQVQNPPVALGESDVLSFSLINTDSDLTESGTSEIAISLEKPIAIHEGDFQFSYDSVSTPFIPAKDCTAYNIGLALNSLSTIVSAGGVEVTGSMPFPLIKFNAAGSRETFVIIHSILGALPYRAVTLTAGTGSVKSTVEFDLSLQTLVKSATATDLTAPTLTVANISTGSVSAYQEDRITLSGKPEAGGFSIRTATDTITRLVPYSASAYEVKSALDAVASGLFTVRRAETGESIYWNIRRLAKGVNDAITVESQLESATGISMSLSLANVRELLSIVGAPAKVPVILSFRYNSVLQFAIPVELTAPDPSGSVSFLTAPDASPSDWGGITGVLANQTDLQAALDLKMDLDSGLSTDGQVWTSDGLGSAAWETPAAGSSMTAAEILAELITVDGTGSGLDADTLDGQHASAFVSSGDLTTHTGNTSNPHSVTKSQVGLSNVDNTSDANKPVSTAAQTALDLKVNSASLATVATTGAYADLTGTPTVPTTLVELDTTVTGAELNAVKSKVDGIEAGADVTDATNVTAAGALMDSEVTNLAQVKAFSSADYATAAQGGLADSAIQPGDDAADLGSSAATDGYVLTADGAGGAAWEVAAGGGGSGTVTSVAVSGSDGIEVDSGSPVTSSGTIALGINASTLSAHLGLGTAATTDATAYAPALGADDNYVTDAEKTVIGNTSGTNSGDNAVNSLYSGLVTNATHTGDVTGATALTIANGAVTEAKCNSSINASLDLADSSIQPGNAALTDERVPTAAGLTSKFGTNKATIVDADKIAILDSAAADAPKHSLFSLIKSTLKTYFDTLYAAALGSDDNYVTDAEKAALHAAATVTGNGISLTGQQISLDIGTGSTQVAAGNHGHSVTGILGVTIDGAGSAITTGIKGYLYVPYACAITVAELVADVSGSIVIDVWKDTAANFPPTDADSIAASAPPTLSSAQRSSDSTLTGWTVSLAAGDYLGFNVDSASTVTRVTLALKVTRTI